MHIDIFIRTYDKDLPWLHHALRSIQKYVTGYRNIIVAIPRGQGKHLSALTRERVVEVTDLPDGYLGQQMSKLEAWQHTDATHIVFWDSDVVATCPVDIVADLFHKGRPILYKTRYSSIEPDCPWRPITEETVGFTVEWEYMRRMPVIHPAQVLAATCEHLCRVHEASLAHYMGTRPYRHFSEFNAVGAIAERAYAHLYHIVDTEAGPLPPNKVDQMWSWGGITGEVTDKLRSYGLL